MPYQPHRIKFFLEEAGWPPSRIAKEHPYTFPQVSMCINQSRVYPEIRLLISRLINKPVNTIFGPHPLTTALLEADDAKQRSAA